jgi:flagellin-like hook-associated protein FlgL
MTVSGVNFPSSQLIQSLIDMRLQLDDLSRQLSTGQKVTTYSGISSQAQMLVGLNAQLTTINGFQSNNSIVNSRLSIAQAALTQFDSVKQTVQQSAMLSNYTAGPNGQTVDQTFAGQQLDQLLNLLNTQADNRFIFSGSAVDQQSVASSSLILNGSATQAGLKQVISERNQADLGANGLGRLVIPAPSTSSAHIIGFGATLQPDAAAVVSGTANIQSLSSAGGTLVVNGQSITIPVGSNAQQIVNAVNLVSGTTNVTASINATNQLVLTGGNANTVVDTTGTTAGLQTELGLTAGATQPMNLVQQGLSGQSLTITVSGNPALTLNFGVGVGQISTLAGLQTALQGLAGGTATIDTSNGNISIAGNNTTSNITIGGTPGTASLFGIQVASASPTPNTRVSLSEDIAGSVFGFKLGSVSSTLTNATATGPTGSPASISVDLATNPSAGDTLTVTFNLPDGTTSDLTLTATNTSPPATNQFLIGATPAATAANLQAALTTGVKTLAATDLTAASAVEAAHNFFDVDVGQPPQRVAGPPFATATALVAGTATNTVTWYTGGMGTGAANARSSVMSRVDSALNVSYGVQANEQGLRSVIENVAVFAAVSFSASNTNSTAAYTALSKRVGLALTTQPNNGNQTTVNIETELANAQNSIKTATDQQQQMQATLQDFVQSITGVSNEEVAAKITTLQTQLSASLQVTAMLTRLNITNYLAPA